MPARIAGIDAPELRGHCAADRDLAVRARAFLIATIAGGPIAMSDIRHGKDAGRVIARVHTATGLDLATALLSEGFARAYQGRGPRPRWCAGA